MMFIQNQENVFHFLCLAGWKISKLKTGPAGQVRPAVFVMQGVYIFMIESGFFHVPCNVPFECQLEKRNQSISISSNETDKTFLKILLIIIFDKVSETKAVISGYISFLYIDGFLNYLLDSSEPNMAKYNSLDFNTGLHLCGLA